MSDTLADRETQSSHSSEPALPESVSSFELLVQGVPGGRLSISRQERGVSHPPSHLFEDIDEVLEAINALRDLAEDNEDLLETESLYRWLVDFARVHGAGRGVVEVEYANTAEEDIDEVEEAEEAEETEEQASYAEEPNEFVAKWLEDVFVLDLAAKILDKIFVGGANEVDDVEDDADALPPCPYCNEPDGLETDQHVVKCKFAHEEQEALDWMWRRGKERL